jgi:hypothetical protein
VFAAAGTDDKNFHEMRPQIKRIARIKTKEKAATAQKKGTNPRKNSSARQEIFYHQKMVVD